MFLIALLAGACQVQKTNVRPAMKTVCNDNVLKATGKESCNLLYVSQIPMQASVQSLRKRSSMAASYSCG
jgi:hypothetical protein